MSLYAILRHLSRWPCEPFKCANTLRNFQHKQISPCELRLTWLPCGPSIRCFSHTTESVFAFLIVNWIWTNSRLLNRGVALPLRYNNLLRCADSVAEYSFGIPNTTHHVPLVLRTTQSSFAICVAPPVSRQPHWPLKLQYRPWLQHLGLYHYPFPYQLTGLVLLWSQHHLLLSTDPSSHWCNLRLVGQRSFHNIQRHCYLHRSYQWRDSHESEQACIVGPLLAQACRTLVLWLPRGSYPKEAMPPNP